MANFFESSTGKAISLAGGILAILIAGYMVFSSTRDDTGGALSNDHVFMDVETGKTFNYTLKIGDQVPVMSPFTKKNTGVLAEACYWTKDGKPKEKPTWVLLNQYKPGHEKDRTFCPDCGRLVVPMNPVAEAGSKPPPTEAEFKAKP